MDVPCAEAAGASEVGESGGELAELRVTPRKCFCSKGQDIVVRFSGKDDFGAPSVLLGGVECAVAKTLVHNVPAPDDAGDPSYDFRYTVLCTSPAECAGSCDLEVRFGDRCAACQKGACEIVSRRGEVANKMTEFGRNASPLFVALAAFTAVVVSAQQENR